MQLGRTFVMGDIHGTARAVKQCLNLVNFNYKKDTLITLGDYIDGYPEPYEVVEELLKIRQRISLLGNHDEWLAEFLRTDYHPAHWNYGGRATILSYLKHAGKPARFIATGKGYKSALEKEDIPLSHRSFFESLHPYYIDEQRRCFLHAGFNRHLSFFKQRPTEYFWNRSLWEEALNCQMNPGIFTDEFSQDCDFKEIFIGHSPTQKFGRDQPMKALNIYNLDTGAGHIGKLTIMNVETKEYWQSDPVTSMYSESEMYRRS